MTINSLTQYQTSFRVVSEDGRPAFPALQNVIYGWVREKEKDNLVHQNKDDFFKRCDWSNLFESRSSIATNTYYDDSYKAWAFRYTEQKWSQGRSRYWYTDIGLKEIGDEVIFYTRVSYANNQHDLNFSAELPQSSIPRFIRYIFKGNYKLYSSKPSFGLFDRPVPVNRVGSGKAIAELIISKERHYPLIVFNGGSKSLNEEAYDLANKLAGKCQVILLGENPDLAEEFRYFLRSELRINYGKFRVYFRITKLNTNPQRHRFYDILDPEYSLQKEGIINGLLRNHTLEEQGCIKNISEIGRLITLDKLHNLKNKNPDQEAEVDKIYELIDEIEKERDDYKEQVDYFASEHSNVEAELRKEKAKQLSFQSSQQFTQSDQAKLDFISSFSTLPNSLADVTKYGQTLYEGRLVFTKEAISEAQNYSKFNELSVAWEILYHLNTTLYDIKFNNPNSCDFEKLFRERTSYTLAMSEGRQTKRNSRLMGLREINHNGNTYDITPHIKWGRNEPKMLRVHFAFDEVNKTIIIGYVGPHMENATTRTRK